MFAGMPAPVGAQRSFARNLLYPNGFAGEQDANAGGHNTASALPIASGPFQGTRESLRQWQVPEVSRCEVRHLGALGTPVRVRGLVRTKHVCAGNQAV